MAAKKIGATGEVAGDEGDTDIVSNYPDGPEADSGNKRLSSEDEVKDMIIRTVPTVSSKLSYS